MSPGRRQDPGQQGMGSPAFRETLRPRHSPGKRDPMQTPLIPEQNPPSPSLSAHGVLRKIASHVGVYPCPPQNSPRQRKAVEVTVVELPLTGQDCAGGQNQESWQSRQTHRVWAHKAFPITGLGGRCGSFPELPTAPVSPQTMEPGSSVPLGRGLVPVGRDSFLEGEDGDPVCSPESASWGKSGGCAGEEEIPLPFSGSPYM